MKIEQINLTDKNKMMKARKYIHIGDYLQARVILAEINHPTAIKWIIKIDRILLDPFSQQSRHIYPAKNSASYTNKAIVALILIWFLFLPGYIAAIVWHGEGKRNEQIVGHSLPGVGMLRILKWLGDIVFICSILFVLFILIVMVSYLW